MALAGITAVGEFHYLHHGPGGSRYDDPNAMGERRDRRGRARPASASPCSTPATCTAGSAGGGGRPAALLRRHADAWAERVDELEPTPTARGSARRSTASARSTRRPRRVVAAWAAERSWPLHAHVSEQPAENEDCAGRLRRDADRGCSPTPARSSRALHRGPRHAPDRRRRRAARRGAAATSASARRPSATSPTASAPARRAARGRRAALASAPTRTRSIDLFEEARAVELDERLATGVRGAPPRRRAARAPRPRAATRRLGWPEAGGDRAPGALADLVTVGLDGVRLAGTPAEHARRVASSSRRPPPTCAT